MEKNTNSKLVSKSHAAYVDKLNFQLCDIFQSQAKIKDLNVSAILEFS